MLYPNKYLLFKKLNKTYKTITEVKEDNNKLILLADNTTLEIKKQLIADYSKKLVEGYNY